MDRTLRYDVFGDLEQGPVPASTREEIYEVQQTLNREFTWTTENLALELSRHCELTYAAPMPRPWAPRLGSGNTMIRDDEWNAALVIRFLCWVSTRLPDGDFIRLRDDGDDLVVRTVLIADGELTFSFLNWTAPPAARWIEKVPAREHVERGELRALKQRIGTREFSRLSLEDAAEYLVSRWLPEEHEAA